MIRETGICEIKFPILFPRLSYGLWPEGRYQAPWPEPTPKQSGLRNHGQDACEDRFIVKSAYLLAGPSRWARKLAPGNSRSSSRISLARRGPPSRSSTLHRTWGRWRKRKIRPSASRRCKSVSKYIFVIALAHNLYFVIYWVSDKQHKKRVKRSFNC